MLLKRLYLCIEAVLEAHGDVGEVTKRVKSALRGLRSKRTPVKPMLAPVEATPKSSKPAVTHTRIEAPKPKLRPRKKIQTLTGNTRIKKLNIKKELPEVISKKAIKAAAAKKTRTAKPTAQAATQEKASDAILGKQLKELETELKQTKAQLKQASDAEKALIRAEQVKDAALKKALHEETTKLKKEKP